MEAYSFMCVSTRRPLGSNWWTTSRGTRRTCRRWWLTPQVRCFHARTTFSRYGLVYASGGKKPSSRRDGRDCARATAAKSHGTSAHPHTPAVLDYRQQGADVAVSSPNTTPIFGIYMMGLVCDYILETHGDLTSVQSWVEHSANDSSSGFYISRVAPPSDLA